MEFQTGWLTTLLNLLPGPSRIITVVLHQRVPPAMARRLHELRRWTPCQMTLPTKDSTPIRVYPVKSCTKESLNDAFTKKMSRAYRRSLRRQYTLQQNDLTRAPFLDAMMGSECSKPCKSMDRKSVVLAAQHLKVVTHILQCLGFIINTKMSLTQELKFLGMLVNINIPWNSLSAGRLTSLPADKVKEITAEAIRISNMVSLLTHLLSHFLGKLSTATQAIPPVPLFYHCLQRDSQQQQSGLQGSFVPITTHPKKTLLVERAPFQMEWEAPKGQVRSKLPSAQMPPYQVGSSLCEELHGWCLVSSGTDNAHQLSGASSSNASSEDLPEGCLMSITAPKAEPGLGSSTLVLVLKYT